MFCIFFLLLVIVLTVSHDNHITVTPAIFIQKPQGSWRVSAAFDLDLSLRFSFFSLPQYRQQIHLNKDGSVASWNSIEVRNCKLSSLAEASCQKYNLSIQMASRYGFRRSCSVCIGVAGMQRNFGTKQ